MYSVAKRRSIGIKGDILQQGDGMPETQAERLLRHAREYGIVRARDLRQLRVPTAILTRLVGEGRLIRRSRGIYTMPEYEPTEHTDLAAVAIAPLWPPLLRCAENHHNDYSG